MPNTLQGKRIVLGITGSIAAYKSCQLIRTLIKQGADVQVVITPAGREFITPLTLSTLTGKAVVCDFFDRRDGTWHSHVDLGLWADCMIIAPATAATIGKMAAGIADNMLITTYLSMKAPVFVAPAMDRDMYAHPATQKNLETLRTCGNHIIEPATGELASHLNGKGRMEEPEVIAQQLANYFAQREGDLQGKTILVTAGPTYEQIDPVRFVGNYSSGKMGFALADECASRGAKVIMIAGPSGCRMNYPAWKYICVESAEQMFNAAYNLFGSADAAILSAAVADFTPEQVNEFKLKRKKAIDDKEEEMMLRLRPTKDIAAFLGSIKTKAQTLVGFALETDNEQQNAEHKLHWKNLDFIVMNSLNDEGAGFRCDTNKVSIIDRDGRTDFVLKPKSEVAADIVNRLAEVMKKK
ncbi:MAG: bifunctional phosphopantothenoylcysteine decarboxylase/phosphopantothenate--cysteine ligase CoaBC [Prevotellaceae bacterium]|jgi:phosphopantothenoylcysteine decarboxylase/phosphopantothenate--cysteine ligase|nr:bifunctional phosphopantothenoylcysteine decarboxylase/phosphopantothenate--cysteine ligase CoaBC [Prevotellaceae bacterium]